jgi:hypothetical protein
MLGMVMLMANPEGSFPVTRTVSHDPCRPWMIITLRIFHLQVRPDASENVPHDDRITDRGRLMARTIRHCAVPCSCKLWSSPSMSSCVTMSSSSCLCGLVARTTLQVHTAHVANWDANTLWQCHENGSPVGANCRVARRRKVRSPPVVTNIVAKRFCVHPSARRIDARSGVNAPRLQGEHNVLERGLRIETRTVVAE